MIINKLNISFRAACVVLSLVAASALAVPASAQEKVSDVLSMIEQNNIELQALRKRAESEQYGYKAERALDAPEIGFDYLWSSPADIGTRKDVSVSQSVDLAALTGARGKLATSKTALSDAQYRIDRQRVLLEAKSLYINIVYCNALASELSERIARSEKIEAAYRDMQLRGETDMIEVNKAHLAYVAQKNALARNEIERASLLADLQRLNGGEAVEVNALVYDENVMLPADFRIWYDEMSQRSPELDYMRKNVEVNASEARTAKMSNYPTLTAGYMAELVKGSNFRGLTLGLSIPLWSVRSKVRQANSSYEASKLEERDAASQLYSSLRGLYEKAKGLQEISSTLSESLAVSTEAMALTEHRLQAGEISLIDNIMEFSLYYSLEDEALEAARDYNLSLAELYAWEL